MKRILTAIISLSPLTSFAEGQNVLKILSDAIDFGKIFLLWFILIWSTLKLLVYYKKSKIGKTNKRIIWASTGLIALFIWSMVKHDPYPYEGPIDSIFRKNVANDYNAIKQDSTIEYSWSIDPKEQGVYIWINNEKVFVRQLAPKEIASKEINDSLTMAILNSWKNKK